jgi:hypothetical protein
MAIANPGAARNVSQDWFVDHHKLLAQDSFHTLRKGRLGANGELRFLEFNYVVRRQPSQHLRE